MFPRTYFYLDGMLNLMVDLLRTYSIYANEWGRIGY